MSVTTRPMRRTVAVALAILLAATTLGKCKDPNPWGQTVRRSAPAYSTGFEPK